MEIDETNVISDESAESESKFPVSREVLYEKVWSQPMLSLAKEYGVSSSYLARMCTLLNVPRPPRGYWAKLAVGKAGKKPPLPEARPDDALEWLRDGSVPRRQAALPIAPTPDTLKRARKRRSKADRPDLHRILRGAKAHFLVGRETENHYLRPNKKLLVDLVVSRTGLDQGLHIVNELFLTLEEYDYRVVLGSRHETLHREVVDVREKPPKHESIIRYWSPWCPTVAFVGTVAIGFTLYEIAEQVEVMWVDGKYVPVAEVSTRRRNPFAHSWTTTHDRASGRFVLQAYSPYPNTSWTRKWEISPRQDIGRLARQCARELPEHAVVVAQLAVEARIRAEEEQRRWKEQRERWDREEKARRQAKAALESKEELFSIMARWGEAKRITEFLQEVERGLDTLTPDEKQAVMDRLYLAREMLGEIDALRELTNWRTPQEREPD